MRYLDEYRDKKLVERIFSKIQTELDSTRIYRFMEVCGTHTMSIFRYGLKTKLGPNIELISGPGCPVCVTEDDYMDKAIDLSRQKNVIIATFGDMLKVPGSESSLEKEKSKGAAIKIVYSTLDALELAEKYQDKKIIFLGVGFETTTPTIAGSIMEAKKRGLKNYFVLSGHKLIPPALELLVTSGETNIDGFILPAHVSTIIGSRPYESLAAKYNLPCVITGFEPLDILQGIYMLIAQIKKKKPSIEIQYSRIAKKEGNVKAREAMNKVFEKKDTRWRGIGIIKASGLKIRKEFSEFDAEKAFNIKLKRSVKKRKGCLCGEILKGVKTPLNCKLFKKACTPENPIGACMVSSEGTCAAYYRYNG